MMNKNKNLVYINIGGKIHKVISEFKNKNKGSRLKVEKESCNGIKVKINLKDNE